MKRIEKEAIMANINTMIANSMEVMDNIKATEPNDINRRMINYEKGMIRGLERSLSLIEDLEAVVEDHKAKLKG